jgi:hypothetical protein
MGPMIRRYYDWDSMRWVTVQVLYAGRGSMPHEIVNAVYWRQKASLTDYAPGREHFPSPDEMEHAVKAPSWRQAHATGPKQPPTYPKASDTPQRAPMRTECPCGRKLNKGEQAKKVARCWRCRESPEAKQARIAADRRRRGQRPGADLTRKVA